MVKRIDSKKSRLKRRVRVRSRISGTAQRPRLAVFRSARHIYAQFINDETGETLASASSLDREFKGNGSNREGAREVGLLAAKAAEKAGIETVVFDRGGFLYHGRVRELAEGAREGGLRF